MHRRELMALGVGAAIATAAACVADNKAAPAKPGLATRVSGDAKSALLAALEACLSKAQLCEAHCQGQLADGHKEFAHCLAAVSDTLAVGWATHALVARGSVTAKKVVDACAATCQECSNACLEHQEHFAHGMHLECRDCNDTCVACIKACQAYLA